MSDFIIRAATVSDIDLLWPMIQAKVEKMNSLGNDQWGKDYPTKSDYMNDILRNELSVAVLETGTPIGVLCITLSGDPDYAGIAWEIQAPALTLHRLVIFRNVQHLGVVSALFQKAENCAKGRSIKSIHAVTYSKNDKMMEIFSREGYEERGILYMRNRPFHYIAYEKKL